MKSLLILLAAFAFAVAMVPRDQSERQERSEEKTAFSASVAGATANTSSTIKPKEICAEHTPCAWSIYKRELRIVEYTIDNIYCVCEPDLVCVETEDDFMASAYVHRCRKLKVRTSTSTEEDSDS